MIVRLGVLGRSRRRAGLLCLTLCVGALAAAGCGSNDNTTASSPASTGGASTQADTSKPINVAFFTALGNTYLEATGQGLEKAFVGQKVNVTPFDSKFDA